LLENSQLSSENGRLGAGGSITVNASSATLNDGRIATKTEATTGGNIQLQSLNTLRMGRNSLISTRAGFESSGVSSSGGNITIQTNRGQVEAATANNSDIIAAATGNGGQVSITGRVNGFQLRQGLSFRDLRNNSSNDLSGSGGVQIPPFPDDDGIPPLPRDLSKRPDTPSDTFLLQFQSPPDSIRQVVLPVCGSNSTAATNPNQFVVSGRGGLPTAPGEPLSVDGVNADLVTPSPIPHAAVPELAEGSPIPHAAIPVDTITEAGGWVKTADGRVTLVASGSPQMAPTACPFARTSER
jgi:large exoprotein involved in heme utilization and adhesion